MLIAITFLSYVQVGVEMIRLSPYEYTYFSPIIGGLPGANGNFDTDYYATCSYAAAEWLSENYRNYTNNSAPSFDAYFLLVPQLETYLPKQFGLSGTDPDFFIDFANDTNAPSHPGYRVIHVVGV